MNKQAWDDYVSKVNEHLGAKDFDYARKNHKYIVWRIHEEGLPDPSGEALDLQDHIMWTMNGLYDHSWAEIWIRMTEVRYNEKGLWIDVKYSLESLREDFALWAHRQDVLDAIEAEEAECRSFLENKSERPPAVHLLDDRYSEKIRKQKRFINDKLAWLDKKKQRVYRAKTVNEVKEIKKDKWTQLEELAKALKINKITAETESDE